MKALYLIRGLPGAGKSTLAERMSPYYLEADMYFNIFNAGEFDPNLLKDAHQWCKNLAESYMESAFGQVVVANTFTQEWEMKPYKELAEKYGYTVFQIIVENHHNGDSVHGVPEGTILKMRKRFDLML